MNPKPLSKAEQEVCVYTGIFGILLGATCIIQFIAITREHWMTFVLFSAYLISVASMLLLAMQRPIAPIALIVGGVLVFGINVLVILAGIFSLISFIYLLYLVAVITVLYMGQYPSKLRVMWQAKQEEKKLWEGKI